MVRKRLVGLALGVLGGAMAILACGSDDEGDKYPSADSFCTAKAAEECKAVAAACAVADDRCNAARKTACNTLAGTATSGGRQYRSANAEACITKTRELYAARTIDPVKEEEYTEACERVFNGAKKKSEQCTVSFDCEGSLICDRGVCAEKRLLSDVDTPCNNPGEVCAKGMYCQQRGENKFCSKKNAKGDTCNDATAPCLEELRCTNTCVDKLPAGSPCDVNTDCATSFCDKKSKKCVAKQYASENGTCADFGGA